MTSLGDLAAGNPLKYVFVGLIRGYQKFVSPALPRSCKYHPSCSQYAIDAFSQYGIFRGFVLASWRLLRCNPLSYGGYDPVEQQTVFRLKPHAEPRGRKGSAAGSAGCGHAVVHPGDHGVVGC
jgi:putative membrane protein insertion efficiency factor